MLFTSISYLFFLPIVLFLYYRLPPSGRRYALLISGWLFYSAYNPWFLWVILATTSVDWIAGARIDESDDPRRRKLWLAMSIISNLGLLGYFKYSAFTADNLGEWFGLHDLGPVWRAALPLGISFHTFQGISYAIDVYRKDLKPVKSFTEFAMFVSFFPQLVAGPIVRAPEFFPQADCLREATSSDMRRGLGLIAYGMFKKVYVADVMAAWVNDAYADPSRISGVGLAFATLAFSVQIYCDFSGYTDIAIGSAKLFGIVMPENFRQPYLSTTLREFWQRWHMTLSRWLRDYLYVPLGGNRHGAGRTYLNLMITMVLGGLWHGSGWNWVVWGAIQGVVMSIERMTGFDRTPSSAPVRLVRWAITLFIVLVSWVFFRARNLGDAWLILTRIGSFAPGEFQTDLRAALYASIGILMVLLAGYFDFRKRWMDYVETRPRQLRWLTYACVIILSLTFSGASKQEFIYFAF